MILNLRWDPPYVTPVIQLTQTQTRLLTWWQEVQKTFAIAPHMVTGATGATGEFCQYPHMTTWIQEKITYCSPGTFSGKQNKARSTSQQQFRSENTPAAIEADQILLALHQLATNSNSAKFNNNISRNSNFPKSLTSTMPTFDGEIEKFQLFEDLF